MLAFASGLIMMLNSVEAPGVAINPLLGSKLVPEGRV